MTLYYKCMVRIICAASSFQINLLLWIKYDRLCVCYRWLNFAAIGPLVFSTQSGCYSLISQLAMSQLISNCLGIIIFKPGVYQPQAGFVYVYVCFCVCVCCVFAPEVSIDQWRVMDPCDWLNKFYSCYIATVVGIVDGNSLGIDTCHGN